MSNPKVTDPNDFKVVEFHNPMDFDFTPELGCKYDGRPLFVGTGERRQFPYYVGHRLAINLAKAIMVKGAPLHDPTAINPSGKALWDDATLDRLAKSFITELYMEDRPAPQSETDILMSRVAELEKLFKQKEADKPLDAPRPEVKSVAEMLGQEVKRPAPAPETASVAAPIPPIEEVKAPGVMTFKDKAEVIAELKKRGIAFNARKSKAELETLLA